MSETVCLKGVSRPSTALWRDGDHIIRDLPLNGSVVAVQSLSCVWFCHFMDCQVPLSSTMSRGLLKFMFIESNYLIILSSALHFFSCLQSFPASGSFLMSWVLASGGQSTGASASAVVLPVNIRGWFPLGLTGLISVQSKGLSRVFTNTTIQKHQFLVLSLLYDPTLLSVHDYWKNHSFDYTNFSQ